MKIKPIRNDRDLAGAIAFIEANFNAPVGSEEGDQVEVLAVLVEAYEAATIDLSIDPIDAIEARMDDLDLTRADLEPVFGTRGRVSEVLRRKRPLTLAQIRALGTLLGLPLDVLAAPYELDAPKRAGASKRGVRRVKAQARRAA